MAILSPEEVYDLTQQKFGKYGPDVVNEMFGIAMRESGGDTNAHNFNPSTMDDSWGLWQINVRPDANPQFAHLDITNPDVNGDVAVQMFEQSGNAPWSTRMEDVGPAGMAPSEVGTTGSGSNFNPLLNPGQAESLPGLVFDQGTGSYVVAATGQKATQADIRSALDRKYPDSANEYTPQQKDALSLQYAQLAEQRRGNDLSYGASIYGSNASMANNAANNALGYAQLGQNQQQFDETQAFAKEQWLFQKQNAIDQLQLQHDQLNVEIANNARTFTLENQKLQFARDQFAFTSAMDLRAETRATQAQMFDQQATVANIQLDMTQIAQHTKELNAQLKNEVAMFNAGKAADVSMFNIDQQTKVATFNAEAKMQTGQFNASMGFEVQKANVENERLRQQQLIDVAGKISEAAKDPGDRGALAAYLLALGGGANIGASDAGLANADFRTNDSLTPLEAMLRQREDIVNSDADPFKFNPLVAPQLAPPQAAVFNPVTATQAPMPDFSGVNVPTPNTTPFDPNSVPKSAPAPAPTYDATKQGFIANGQNTIAPTEQFQNWGTAEQRAQIPDFVLQDMIARGQIPAMATGGVFDSGQVLSRFDNTPVAPQVAAYQQARTDATTQPQQQNNQQVSMPNFGGGAHIPTGEMPQQGYQPGGMGQHWRQFIAAIMARYAHPQQGQHGPFSGNSQYSNQQHSNIYHMPNPFQMANQGGGMQGAFIAGDEAGGGVNDTEEIVIPIGPGQAVVLNNKQTKKALKGKAKPKKMATGGVFDQTSLGKSMYEGLLSDTDRTRSQDFLTNALGRATAGTGFNAQHLPTPVFFSSPGTSSYLTDVGAALSALARGIPPGYFTEQAQRQAPVGYSEGAIGRTR